MTIITDIIQTHENRFKFTEYCLILSFRNLQQTGCLALANVAFIQAYFTIQTNIAKWGMGKHY